MSSGRALRYVVLTRWRNRVRSWIARLRTPTGILGAALGVLVIAGFALGGDIAAERTLAERKAYLGALLGFLFVMGALSGLGQRGLVFTRADLDLLFPAPIPKRQLLLYYFLPGYPMALFIALIYVLLLGGRGMPAPFLFYVGTVLCLVTNAHLGALTAEASMLLADGLYARVRRLVVVLVVALSLACLALVLGGLTGLGGIHGWVRGAWESGVLQVVFYPALKAVELGSADTVAAAVGPLAALLACAIVSFLLVLWLPVDFLESSYVATRQVRKRMEQARRGVHGAQVRASSRGPRGRWTRGAGAVVWLNALTMRRQLRAVLGGLVVVTVLLVVFAQRSSGGGRPEALLTMLTLVPLWMPLPIGFRLPRDQLLALRLLPLPPARLAGALLAVPALLMLVLQALGVMGLAAVGRLEPALAVAVLPAYLVTNATSLGVESVFVMQRPHPNQVHFGHEILRMMLQIAALMPGIVTLAAVTAISRNPAAGTVAATVVQAGVTLVFVRWIGRRLQRMEVTGETG